jgi:hypothetical protein
MNPAQRAFDRPVGVNNTGCARVPKRWPRHEPLGGLTPLIFDLFGDSASAFMVQPF